MGRKTFYTERDIEDLAQQGVTSLPLHDDVVLTDLAREKASRLGISLVESTTSATSSPVCLKCSTKNPPTADVSALIKAAVLAQLENRVSEELLDDIIPKILERLGKK